MYVCVSVRVCICVCMYVYVCVCMCIHINMCVYICVRVTVYVCVYIIRSTIYNVHCTLYSVQKLYNVHCTLYSVQWLYIVHCTVYIIQPLVDYCFTCHYRLKIILFILFIYSVSIDWASHASRIHFSNCVSFLL